MKIYKKSTKNTKCKKKEKVLLISFPFTLHVRAPFFVFFSLFLFISKVYASKLKMPQDIQNAINALPEKSITLDFIFDKIISSSTELKMILSQKISKDSSYLRSKALLKMDYQLFSNFNFLNDSSDGLTTLEPRSKIIPDYTLGISKNFSSGTNLSFQWNYYFAHLTQNQNPLREETNQFSFFQPPDQYHHFGFSFIFSQSLLRNSFGKSMRKHLESHRLMKEVIRFEMHEDIENLFLNITDIFYKIWFLKKKIKAAKENFDRQRRLLNITDIKKKRGTEVQSHFLLIKANLIAIEQEKKLNEQALKEIWIYFVISLKFPDSWIHLDPSLIPMKLQMQRKKALKICNNLDNMDVILKRNPEIQKMTQELESKELIAAYWKDQLLPELSLKFKLDSNSYDEKKSVVFNEASRFKHPSWSVGLNFRMALSYSQEKAALLEATQRKSFLTFQLEKKRLDFKSHWLNQCQKLKTISNKIENYHKVYDIQKKRSQLEERRFQIGRTSAFNAIQAGKDATNSESVLYKSIHDAEILSWKIYQMHGHFLDSILGQMKVNL